jgi:hypothetical protein
MGNNNISKQKCFSGNWMKGGNCLDHSATFSQAQHHYNILKNINPDLAEALLKKLSR